MLRNGLLKKKQNAYYLERKSIIKKMKHINFLFTFFFLIEIKLKLKLIILKLINNLMIIP